MSSEETLADLMTRMERRRRHYQRQHDFVRLIAVGVVFIFATFVLTTAISPYVLVIPLLFSPYILAAYRMTEFRLGEEFLRETIGFYLKPRGVWRYESYASSFPLNELRALGVLDQRLILSHGVSGDLRGTPVAMANIISVGASSRKFIKAPTMFSGFVVRLKPFGLPPVTRVEDLSSSWQEKLSALNAPRGSPTAPLLEGMPRKNGVHVTVHDGAIWLLTAAPSDRYGRVKLATPLNEPAPYQRVEAGLNEMFSLAEKVG